MKTLSFDLIIIGGGISGLWTLNRAVKAGYNAILLEKDELGGAQTVRSQGIIHGGTKYALNGILTQASNTIRDMPQRWKDCLNGEGELDLSAANTLSDAHFMWSKGSIGSRMTTFFATKAFQGRVEEVTEPERPAVFQNKQFKGSLYRLNELVLETPSLIEALRNPVADRIFQVDITDTELSIENESITSITLKETGITLLPKQLVLTSGEGIEHIANTLHLPIPKMQRRPLHMIMVKHSNDLPIFAHCIGTGSKPIATITTHPCKDGKHVWYLGGDVAETGVNRSEDEQIQFAQQALSKLLPWVNLEDAQWSCLRVNRAEPQQSSLVRPDSAYTQKTGNIITAWPTKLALSPDLADQVLQLCEQPSENSAGPLILSALSVLSALPKPLVAQPVWETCFD